MKSFRDQVRILISLQDVDRQIAEMRRAKEEIPRELDSHRAEIQEFAALLEEAREKQSKLEQGQRAIEHEIQLEKEQIKRFEERVAQIKTNKEYQALLKEISIAKKMKEDSEDEFLKSLMVIDENKKVIAERESALRQKETDFKDREQALLARLAEVEAKINGVVESRNQMAADVDRSLLQRYDLILQKREGVALAHARDEICQACHRNIPPQVYNELLKDESLLTCPNCQRILYHDPESEPQESALNA